MSYVLAPLDERTANPFEPGPKAVSRGAVIAVVRFHHRFLVIADAFRLREL